ncbi:MAG: PQQ-binding-like beta-propeller repeat protein [bacterium]
MSTLYSFLKKSLLLILPLLIFSSCNKDIHRNGKLLFYKSNGTELFILYQNNNQNNILSLKLSPLKKSWENKISGHPAKPAFFLIEDFLLCNCKKGKVCLIDKSSGETAVSIDSTAVITEDSVGFTVNDGIFYTLCKTDSICAIDIEENSLLWESKLKEEIKKPLQFKIEEKYLIYGDNNDRLIVLNKKDGKEIWKTSSLENLENFYTFPETLVAEYGEIDGFDIAEGSSKWVTQHSGKIRCVTDGLIVLQDEDFFTVIFAENGLKIWDYPKTGTTFLTCQESLSLVAFTVKNLEDSGESDSLANEYFDKVYIFEAADGNRVFEYKSSDELRVLNVTGFFSHGFYLALEEKQTSDREITVKEFSTADYGEGLNYTFSYGDLNEEIYVSYAHSDKNYTIFRVTTIATTPVETNYLFKTESAEFLGVMEGYPEVVTGTNVYDIISYDNYFNIIEKTLPDFLIYD